MPRRTVFRWKLIQIIPAQPGTFALFNEFDEKPKYYRRPVPAFGLWDQWKVDAETLNRIDKIENRVSGPLVIDLGTLVPAEHMDETFCGVRIGGFRSVGDGEEHFDDQTLSTEDAPEPYVTTELPTKESL